MTQQSPLPPDHLEKDEINLVDILLVFLKRKKLIITITLTATLISVVVSLLWPRMYTATAQILPPKDSNSGASALLAAAGSTLGTLAGGMGGMGGSSADLYVGILKSRNAADALITRFDLKTVYDEDYLEDVHVKLGKRTTLTRKQGLSASQWRIEIQRGPQRWRTHMWKPSTGSTAL